MALNKAWISDYQFFAKSNCKFRMKIKIAHLLCSFIIVFASIRGAFVYHMGFSPDITYKISALMLLSLGAFSLLYNFKYKLDAPLVLFKNAVLLNIVFFGFFIFGGLLIAYGTGQSASSPLSWLYYFLVFPVVFLLLRFNDNLLSAIVSIVAVITAIGVYYFFNLGLSGGFDEIYEAHSILRPGEFRYSRLGLNLLPFGYTGSHHDTANILVICGIFFLARSFICNFGIKSLSYFSCYLVILLMIMITGSAANFLVFLFMTMVSLVSYIQKSPTTLLMSFLLSVLLILFIPSIIVNSDFTTLSQLTYVFDKFNPEQMDPDLWAGLDAQSIKKSLLSVFLGFGGPMKSPLVLSEIGFLSLLSRLGLLPLCILIFIGFSPIYYLVVLSINRKRYEQFRKKNMIGQTKDSMTSSRNDFFRVLMMSMPVLAGFLTLIHYGSVFRITSIGLFCVVLAMFFKEYITVHQGMVKKRS